MRRALIVGLSIGALAAGIALCTRSDRRQPSVAEAPSDAPPPTPPSPPLPRPAKPPTVPPDATRAVPPPASEEQGLLLQIRALVKTDPQQAETLARESRRRFPEGDTADERDALLVDALINQQRIGRARDETYYYFDHHPRGRFAEHLFIMTGVHPQPKRPAE
jgi:type IV secretory pathway VirB10-like protein